MFGIRRRRLSSGDKALDERLRLIDDRLAAIEGDLAHLGASFRRQELEGERAELLRLRRETVIAIDAVKAGPTPADAEREAVIDGWTRNEMANLDRQIEMCERAGDFRQARIWRMAKLDVRRQVERQLA